MLILKKVMIKLRTFSGPRVVVLFLLSFLLRYSTNHTFYLTPNIDFRKEILSRMADAQVQRPETSRSSFQQRPEDLMLEPPPSYDEAMANSPSTSTPSNYPSLSQATPSSSNSPPQTYTELGEALRNLKVHCHLVVVL